MVRILNFHPADWGSNSHFIYHLSFSISLINLFKSSHIFSYMQIYSDFVGFNSKFPILDPPKLLIASVYYQQYSNPLECTLSLEPYVHQIWCTLIILVLLFVYWNWLWFYLPKFCFSIDFFLPQYLNAQRMLIVITEVFATTENVCVVLVGTRLIALVSNFKIAKIHKHCIVHI